MIKDLKKKIIRTSYNLFKEKGYDETTVNDICEACEITKPTFYRYVASKEDILSHFFDQIQDELGDLIVNLATADNYWQQIVYAFDLILKRMKIFDRALYAQLLVSNLKSYKGTFDEIDVLKNIVVILIRKAQESGQIHNMADAEELYAICTNLCFGCAIKWCMGIEEREIEEVFLNNISIALQVDEKFML